MRNEGNIGQTNKTSVKVHHQPGGQSSFSLGWGVEEKAKPSTLYIIIQFKSITIKVMLFLEALIKNKMRKKRKDSKNKKGRKKSNSIRNYQTMIQNQETKHQFILVMKNPTIEEKMRYIQV